MNHAPFAAFGGWGGGINAAADPKVKDAAFAFFSYMTQPAQSNPDVTVGGTGFNPYRTSQLSYSDLWKNAGMSEEEAKIYLGAINDSMNSPNMILDLRIPQNQRYQQVVLDEAISRFLAGEIDKEATVKAVEDGWNELNDEIGTRRAARDLQGDDRRQLIELRRSGARAPVSGRAAPRPTRRRQRMTAAADTAPDDRPTLGWRAARPAFRPPHGAAGGDHASLLRDLSADHLGLPVAVALRARAGRLHAQVHRPDELSEAAGRLAAVPFPRRLRRASGRCNG